jgi:two-component system nitrogen regulation sensor histidine kinase NtrY
MGFDRNFTVGLIWRLALLQLALVGVGWAFLTPGLGATRIVACLVAMGAIALLWSHVFRTNMDVARFVEALHHGDLSAHFEGRPGSGFEQMGKAFDSAIRRLRDERRAASDELGFLEALVNDVPVPLLTVSGDGQVSLANKAARRLFTAHDGVRAEDFAVYGATFASRLDLDGPLVAEVLILNLNGRAHRAIVNTAGLTRLGTRARAVIVQPVQDTLNAVEMAAQTDLVRVLTHEILNSLTPVTSLAATASGLMREIDDPRVADARLAIETLERRAEGLARFINSYRKVASEPRVERKRFEATPFTSEMVRLFAAEWPAVDIQLSLTPPAFIIDADPDLLAQAVINLMRNAGEAASSHSETPRVILSMERQANAQVLIAVRDNGAGVPEDLRRDVFLPFFTTRAKGTGVGLNLVRQIAVAHGGTVDVHGSELGGARFELLI